MRRRLKEQDRQLWDRVTQTVIPLHAARRIDELTPADTAKASSGPETGEPVKGAGTMSDATAHDPGKTRPKPKPPAAAPALDRADHRRLARGRTHIEARLDLHDMTQDVAHHRLSQFLVQARARGLRHVIIITGKGSANGGERGVLRRMVPHWLETPPFRDHVGAYSAAARQHGGDGALYVRLKRADRRGPVSK